MQDSENLLRMAVMRLREAGNPSPRLDARLLLADVLGMPAQELVFSHPVCDEAVRRFEGFVQRRLAGEPVSRILGMRAFWSLDFALSPETLDPRPDSETVVEMALDWARAREGHLDIWDAGTGTGCLLLALLSELPQAHGIGSDISEDALATARENARRLGLLGRATFRRADWLVDAEDESVDLFISNPPYIPEADMAGLQAEVRLFDPCAALCGGADGLDPYRAIARDLPRVLKPSGRAFLEFGQGQEEAVAAIMEQAGLQRVDMKKDLAGIVRALSVQHA
ncbi:MAG TPA: peptide chain release factor N(5)-glutamine methyltransferase [Rhodospirillaceae bacterium]|nr:MAG: protein-(glutamine-N5) methyltransferase, release factor-specific [Alphaproteobacteria bacterium GWF2_58_20]HAU29236.1 peptide chain release factor N(5)-glutamine methyltransferase [Rhodospirillaceae bacterium]